jgi:RNA polymerase sigma-70 factor (ECF subfamily)
MPADPRASVERLTHAGRPRLVAALLRRFGPDEIDAIETAVQDALVRALERWPVDGVPARPEGWVVRVAHNLAVDALRRRSRLAAVPAADAPEPATLGDEPTAHTVDDQLCLMFLCCHPALPRAAQIALTLKIACGFSTQQIGLAFLTDEPVIAQRVVRAKQLLRRARPVFELPEPADLPARLEPILDVLYLVLGEGHSPTDGDAAIKQELCDEALRLARLVAPLAPAASALCALCCFQASRAAARIAGDGSLLLLPEQDRTAWDRALIDEGFGQLSRAAHGAELSRFHLEAGIAACHAAAPTHDATDWAQIVSLYELLHARAPSPVVDVNRAIAIAMLSGAHAGLDELDAIPERELIDRYPYALAAYAELYASLGELDRARRYLDRALRHQPSRVQRALLERKRAALAR